MDRTSQPPCIFFQRATSRTLSFIGNLSLPCKLEHFSPRCLVLSVNDKQQQMLSPLSLVGMMMMVMMKMMTMMAMMMVMMLMMVMMMMMMIMTNCNRCCPHSHLWGWRRAGVRPGDDSAYCHLNIFKQRHMTLIQQSGNLQAICFRPSIQIKIPPSSIYSNITWAFWRAFMPFVLKSQNIAKISCNNTKKTPGRSEAPKSGPAWLSLILPKIPLPPLLLGRSHLWQLPLALSN